MNDITTGTMTADEAYFCPTCGSPAVDMQGSSLLLPGMDPQASCRACEWRGTKSTLLTVPIGHEFRDQEDIAQHLIAELRLLTARTLSTDLARFLVKWGFVDAQRLNPRLVGEYLAAVTIAMFKAIVDVREKVERVNRGRQG